MTKSSRFGGALSRLKGATGKPEDPQTGEDENMISVLPESTKTRQDEKGIAGKVEDLKARIPEVSVATGQTLPTAPPPKLMDENLETEKPESLKADSEGRAAREKYSTYLDGDLVTRMKILAAKSRRKHHHIVEDALREYLDRHGA